MSIETLGVYSRFFMQTRRFSSQQKKIAIVRGERFVEFLVFVMNDQNMTPLFRAFVIVCYCGGLRVTEGLNLTKVSFYREGSHLFADVKVLKKRREETRTIMLHPDVADFVESTIEQAVGAPFKWSYTTCYRRMIKLFNVPNLTPHSSRHSAISYYLFEAKLSREETARLVHVSVAIIDKYAHLDEKRVLKSVFCERKAA